MEKTVFRRDRRGDLHKCVLIYRVIGPKLCRVATIRHESGR